MKRQIYLNLPVKDVQRSQSFFESVGFRMASECSSDKGMCIELQEDSYAVLQPRETFEELSPKEMCRPAGCSEMLISVSCESREEVDELIDRAIEAGAKIPGSTKVEGPMYGRTFEDLDGHVWQLIYMDGRTESND